MHMCLSYLAHSVVKNVVNCALKQSVDGIKACITMLAQKTTITFVPTEVLFKSIVLYQSLGWKLQKKECFGSVLCNDCNLFLEKEFWVWKYS